MKLLCTSLFLLVNELFSSHGQSCALIVPKRQWRHKLPSKTSRAPLPIPPNPTRRSDTPHFLVTRGGAQTTSPRLIRWIGPALSSAVLMALYSICIKVSSSSIHPILGGFVLQLVAVLLGSALLGVSARTSKLYFDSKGLLWSICAGLAVGAAELVSFQVSAMGVQASQSIPVMIGGSVAFGSVLGAILLKERMTIRGWVGVTLVVAGIVCVATDPGASLGH